MLLFTNIVNTFIVVNASVTADASAAKPRVVGEGCLGPALELLAQCREPDQDNVKVAILFYCLVYCTLKRI